MWVSFLFPSCAFFQVTKLACHPFSLCPRVLLNIPYISLTPLSIVDTRSCDISLITYDILLANSVLCLYFDRELKLASDGGLIHFFYSLYVLFKDNHEIKELWNKNDVLLTTESFCKNF